MPDTDEIAEIEIGHMIKIMVKALTRAVKEGRHGPMCDRGRCVCWKSDARAALKEAKDSQ